MTLSNSSKSNSNDVELSPFPLVILSSPSSALSSFLTAGIASITGGVGEGEIVVLGDLKGTLNPFAALEFVIVVEGFFPVELGDIPIRIPSDLGFDGARPCARVGMGFEGAMTGGFVERGCGRWVVIPILRG